MPGSVISRYERFAVVGSTSDVVRGWLEAGEPEVCLAVADEQSAGRGRQGRSWWAPAGRGLLLSLGFRPTWLGPEQAWRLGAIVSLAMAGAAEEAVGLADGAVRLKWPNDLVIEPASGLVGTRREWPGPSGADAAAAADGSGGREAEEKGYRKLGGVLGETIGLGSPEPVVIVGLGVNADWPAEEFPAPLAAGMTSLREAGGGRPVDRAGLLEAFLSRLAGRVEALRSGHFDVAEWTARQLVQGRVVRLERPDGSEEQVRVRGVDTETGALLVDDEAGPGGQRSVLSGEVRHLRMAVPEGVTK